MAIFFASLKTFESNTRPRILVSDTPMPRRGVEPFPAMPEFARGQTVNPVTRSDRSYPTISRTANLCTPRLRKESVRCVSGDVFRHSAKTRSKDAFGRCAEHKSSPKVADFFKHLRCFPGHQLARPWHPISVCRRRPFDRRR